MREIKKAIKVLIENADSIVYDNTITNINDFVRTIKRKNMIYYAKNPLIEHNIFILESYLKIINSKFQDNINELFQEIKNARRCGGNVWAAPRRSGFSLLSSSLQLYFSDFFWN